MKVVVKMFISPLEHIVAALSPLECSICNKENFMLCFACRPQILGGLDSRCYLCNKLVPQHQVCPSCRSRSALRRVWWLGAYETALKTLIYQMKYQRRRVFARQFGTYLAETIPYLPEDTLVVPAPTATGRVRARGYDQAVLIAAAFAKARSLPFCNALNRSNQADQIGTGRRQRFEQMKHSFAVKPTAPISGASILLIDDVLTTGATLEAAARLLRSSGARHVDAAVIARHLPA